MYILLTVPYSGDQTGTRAYFYSREDCPGVSPDQWSRAVAWLRNKGSITTSKIRHGVLVKVAHFARYQQIQEPQQPTPTTAPLSAMWQKATGGSPSGRSLTTLEKLLAQHGLENVTRALERYLAATEPRYVSASRLAETFGTWLTEPKSKTQPTRGRAALTGHKGSTDYGAIDPTR
jgi:hypothetical protein